MNMQTPLSADITAQLAGLHDIHLPDPIAWWPLAPGWWALAGLAVIATLCIALVQQRRRRSLKQAALRELAVLETTYSDEDNVQALAAAVGVLIRRVALSLPGGRLYANVHGQRWSDYLAAMPAGMSESIADLLAVAPYAESTVIRSSEAAESGAGRSVSNAAIITEAGTWIRGHA